MTTTLAAGAVASSTAARAIKAAALVGLLILIPPLANHPYITTIFISALMFGLLGATYDLMLGYAGLANFGYAGFIAAGAYGSALASFHYGISPWIGLLIGGLCGGLMGLLTGVITLRLRGLYLGLTTWFIAEALRFTISNTPGYTRGVLGLAVDPFPNILGIDFSRGRLLHYYYLLVVLGAVIMVLMQLLVSSRIGLAFKAIREDQLATESSRPQRDQVQADQLHGRLLLHRRDRLVLRPLSGHPVADARGVRRAAHGRGPDHRLRRRPRHALGFLVRGVPPDRLSGVFSRARGLAPGDVRRAPDPGHAVRTQGLGRAQEIPLVSGFFLPLTVRHERGSGFDGSGVVVPKTVTVLVNSVLFGTMIRSEPVARTV